MTGHLFDTKIPARRCELEEQLYVILGRRMLRPRLRERNNALGKEDTAQRRSVDNRAHGHLTVTAHIPATNPLTAAEVARREPRRQLVAALLRRFGSANQVRAAEQQRVSAPAPARHV